MNQYYGKESHRIGAATACRGNVNTAVCGSIKGVGKMKEPIWLLEEAMQEVHERVIAEFGGAGGVRDAGRLSAALMRPQQAYAYEVTDLFVLAASYAHAIVKGHPFVDGNKRTGLLAALVFLECNGVEFHAPQQQVIQATLALAAGEDLEQESFAEWLRSR
jgi:death-on-curing protein